MTSPAPHVLDHGPTGRAPPSDRAAGRRIDRRGGLAYGALGLPLAFAALPLYVLLPAYYAEQHGVPLAALGAVLLGARLLDALWDPLFGRWVDLRLRQAVHGVGRLATLAAVLLVTGFAALFHPPAWGVDGLLAWCAGALALTYFGYSLLGVLHQAWGTRLGGDAPTRATIAAWREGASLVGVLLASVLPSWAGLTVTTAVFASLLAAALGLLLRLAPRHEGTHVASAASGDDAAATAGPSDLWRPWRVPAFRRLLAVFLVNGIASAIPATLVLFFVRDRLQAPELAPGFLAAYFAAAALSMPLWLRVIARRGLVPAWRAGMALAVLSFVATALLDAGDTTVFFVICLATGVALGADLSVPGALLTGVVRRAGDAGRHEGRYVGWWAFATKLNLALAAGVALPALQAWGYAPGSRDPDALWALSVAYGALPCLLKLIALALLPRVDELDPLPGEPSR